MLFRALQAVKLLSRIRQERPDLWSEIAKFANGRDKLADLMLEAEHDYRELFEEQPKK